MSRVVCIGELLVDMIGEQEASLRDNSEFKKRAGGAPANVAVAASRLEADVELVAAVGEDEFGKFLLEKMRGEGIGTSRVKMRSGEKTTLAFVALDESARPQFSFYRGADEFIVEEQLQLDLNEEDILHVGSLPFTRPRTAENILNLVNSSDAKVSFDPNLRDELKDGEYASRLERLIEEVDILTAAEEEIKFFGGLERLRTSIDEIILTKGESGAELITGSETTFEESREVEVVDTTGAGDALTGAYLAFRQRGAQKALEKAVEAASLSTTSKGAMRSLPSKSELG